MAERESLKQQITAQVDEIIKSLSNEIRIAVQRRTSLEKELKEAETDLAKANQAQVRAAQLIVRPMPAASSMKLI